jgi:TolA-binding protein
MKRLSIACLALVCAAALPWSPARAQVESREGIALQNQILELRQEVQGLRDAIAHGQPAPGGGSSLGGYQTPPPPSAPSGDMNAQLLDRVQRLEDELRTLRGRIDEVDNARQRQGDDLGKQIGDLNFKLGIGAGATPPGTAPAAGGGLPGTPPTGLVPPPEAGQAHVDVPPPPPPPPPRRTPELLLQEGYSAYARRDYTVAEADARQVLAAGKGPRTADANFLLAQSLAGRKDFSAAAVAYDDAYERSPTGSRAQDSLLGLANALTALSDRKAACETLEKLRGSFPSPRADLRESIAVARRNAGCR